MWLKFTPPFWSQNLEKNAQLIYKQITSPLPAPSLWNEQVDNRDTILPETKLMVRSYFTQAFLPWDSSVKIREGNTFLAHQKHLYSNGKRRSGLYKTWKMVYRILKKFLIFFLKCTSIISQIRLNVFQSWERYSPYAFVMDIFNAIHLMIWSFKQLKWKFYLALWKCAK